MKHKKPEQVVEQFDSLTLKEWSHYEHIVICIHYALLSENPIELMGKIRCAFIRRNALMNTEYHVQKCTEKYNESKTWFWVNVCFHLVQNNPGKTLTELVNIADEKEYMDKLYVHRFYKAKFIDTEEAKSIIVIKIKKESFA